MSSAAIVIFVFGLIIAAAVIVINFFIAKEFYKAAVMKGWNYRKYFWIAFLLPFAGYVLVAALPDRGDRSGITAVVSDDLPEL